MPKKAGTYSSESKPLDGSISLEKHRLLRARFFPSTHDIEALKSTNDKRNTIWQRELSDTILRENIQKNIQAYEKETIELEKKERLYYENRIVYINLLTKFDEEYLHKLKWLQNQYLIISKAISSHLEYFIQLILERINGIDKLINHLDDLINKVDKAITENKIELIDICKQIVDALPNLPTSQTNILTNLISEFTNGYISLENFYERFVTNVNKFSSGFDKNILSLLNQFEFLKHDIEAKTIIKEDLLTFKQEVEVHKTELYEQKDKISKNMNFVNSIINEITLPDMSNEKIKLNAGNFRPSLIDEVIYSKKLTDHSTKICNKMFDLENRLLNNINNKIALKPNYKSGVILNKP